MSYSLQDAIYGSQYGKYIYHRMRFFLVVSLTTLAINGIEIFLIRQHLTKNVIIPVIAMRIYIGIASLGWWGTLEMMREYIRSRVYFSEKKLTSEAIGHWMLISLIAALLFIFVPFRFFMSKKQIMLPDEQLIFNGYLIAYVLHGLLSFIFQTYRSGVYAIRRVYRPLGWVLGPGIISFMLMLFLWKIIGLVGLPIAFILGEFIDTGIRCHFTRKIYKQLKLDIKLWSGWSALRLFIQSLSLKNLFQTWFAGTLTNFINIILLVYLSYVKNQPTLLIYSFVIRQIYHAYAHWGEIFYFDLKKLCSDGYTAFYNGFLKKLFPLTFIISTIFWLIANIFSLIFDMQNFWTHVIVIGIFFQLTSIFSILVVHSFCQSRFIDISLASCLGMEIFFMFHSFSVDSTFTNSIAVFFGVSTMVAFLWQKRFAANHSVECVRPQSIYNMIIRIEESKKGYQILKIRTNPKMRGHTLEAFMSKVSIEIDQEGWICPLKTNEFLLIEKRPKLSHKILNGFKKDMIKSCITIQVHDKISCFDVIQKEVSKEILKNPFYLQMQECSAKLSAEWISELFKKEFPGEISTSLSDSDTLINQEQKAEIYKSIEKFFMLPLSQLRNSHFISSLSYIKSPKVFIIKKSKDNYKKTLAWNTFIHYTNFSYFSASGYEEGTSITLKHSKYLHLGQFLE
ncbi:MAG: hypothetical protein FJZ57_01940 [Chlamydiae bacterium]|nr:hypothetical protein [Chlamydiota bacterium]